MKNSEIAEGALEIIEEKGWTRGQYRNDYGYCLIGAGLSAMGVSDALLRIDEINDAQAEMVTNVIRPGIPQTDLENLHYVWMYNDNTARAKSDIRDTLTNAAKYWRDRGE